MRFLKTLQKKQFEQPLDIDALDKVAARENGEKHDDNKPLELFAEPELNIGRPNPVFDKLADSLTLNNPPNFETVETETADKEASRSQLFKEKGLLEITVDPARVNPHLVVITQPNSQYSEEYRSLRMQVLQQSQKQKLQSIVIASIRPSEGKSITALNLSWLLAQTSGVSALIIDSDLRMPSLTEYLGIEAEIGLSEALEGTFPLKDLVIRLKPAGLHLLPSGRARGDVTELILGAKFKEILREAGEMFDYVIIDAPPLGIFTDAAALINHADSALLVVRANHTPYKDIERILESLPRAKMLGAILNQSEEASARGDYYNYGYYKKIADENST